MGQRHEYLMEEYFQEKEVSKRKVCGYIRHYGLDNYIGTVYDNVEVTQSGLLAACHLVGVGSMREALSQGVIKYDGNGVAASQYLDLFGGYDISEVW